MVVCEFGSHKCPHIACVSESMKQHDCRALSANSDMNCRAVGLNLLSTEVGRKYGLSTCAANVEGCDRFVSRTDDYSGYLLWFGQHWHVPSRQRRRCRPDMF